MKHFLILAMSFGFSFLSSTPSNADLVLDITGVADSGVTTWIFSESDIAGTPEAFNFEPNFGMFGGDPVLDDSIFAEQGDMFKPTWNSENTFVAPPSGATVTTPNGTRNIDLIYLKEREPRDDIGFYVSGDTDLEFATGDEVSWTGSIDLNIDINEMNEGSYTYDYFAFKFDSLVLTVNIAESDGSAVPEPSAVLFLGLSGIAILTRRRRRS